MKFKLSLFTCIIFLLPASYAQAQKSRSDTVLNLTGIDSVDHLINLAAYNVSLVNPYLAPISFKKEVIFDGVRFNGKVSFSGDIFKQRLAFTGASFPNKADFSESQFQKSLVLSRADLKGQANFSQDDLWGPAFFENTHFEDTVSFYRATFKAGASFAEARFDKVCAINAALFGGKVSFSSAQFNKGCYFAGTRFKDALDLSRARFNGKCDFSLVDFKTLLDMSDLATTDSTTFNFNDAHLPDLINLSGNPDLKHLVDLSLASLEPSKNNVDQDVKIHYINLFNTDIAKVKIDYEHFKLCFYEDKASNGDAFAFTFSEDKDTLFYNSGDKKTSFKIPLAFKDTVAYRQLLKMDEIRLYLQQIFPKCEVTDPVAVNFLIRCIQNGAFPKPLSKDKITAIYEKALKNFDGNGQKESYQALDIEYKDYKSGWFIIPHIWNCYGYRREWVFYWALAFLVFFTAITYTFIEVLNKPTTEGGVYHMDNLQLNPATDSWYLKLWYAFMYTSTLFFILKVDVGKLNFKKKAGVFYIIIVYSLGVLCLGYMANFVLQK